MKISKEYILALSALVATLGVVGGVYQFYYRERLAEYQQNIQDEEKFADALNELESKFEGCKPQKLISAINGEVNPMLEELRDRAAFFAVNDLLEIEPIPQDKMLGFYYREEFGRLFGKFREEQLQYYPNCYYPPDITFGAPVPDAFTGVEVKKPEVRKALQKVVFGISMLRLLMDSKALYITDVQLWPPRWLRQDKLFAGYTVGLAFAMMPKDLVNFVEKLRVGEVLGQKRYVNIEAFSIQNKYLQWPTEPPVEVQMLVTFVQANIEGVSQMPGIEMASTAASVASGRSGGGSKNAEDVLAAWRSRLKAGKSGRPGEEDEGPPSAWDKFVRFLDRHFWPFN